MCRRRVGAIAVLLSIAALAAPPTAEGQVAGPTVRYSPQQADEYDPPASEEELLARIEALRPLLDEAARDATAATDRRRLQNEALDRAPLDTIQEGPFRIVVPEDQSELARELFSGLWETEFEGIFAGSSLGRLYFTFQWRLRLVPMRMVPESAGGDPVSRVEVERFYYRTRSEVRDLVRNEVLDAFMESFPPQSPLRRWLSSGSYLDWERAYRGVALSASRSGVYRSCFSGDEAACWAALGLGYDGSSATLERWYTPDERRTAARTLPMFSDYFDGFLPPESGSLEWECIDQDDQAACDRFLQENFGWPRLQPISRSTSPRWTLLWHALSQGGEGSWERALERVDSHPAEVLTHASGMSPEQLASSWRAELHERRPGLYADLGAGRWTVLFWVMAFMGLAMRSTRWRSA